jgi:hypothetical protein
MIATERIRPLGTFIRLDGLSGLFPQSRSYPMREQRRMAAPAPAPVNRATTELPTSGYALVVDGQMKTEFKTKDRAVNAARDLKSRFPMLQVKVYDAETKRSDEIELAAA